MRSIVRAILRSDECAPVVYTSFKQFASCAAKYALVTSGNYIHSLVRPLLLSRHLLERRQSFDAVIDLHARVYIFCRQLSIRASGVYREPASLEAILLRRNLASYRPFPVKRFRNRRLFSGTTKYT